MLSYLPENLYETIKNDLEYSSMIEKYTNNIFFYDDVCFVNSLLKYDDSNDDIQKIKQLTYNKIDKKYHKILDILFDIDYRYNKNNYINESIETQLLSIYYANNGDTKLSNEFYKRINDFISIYEENKNKSLSPFIHIIAYTYYLFKKIYEINNKNIFNKSDIDLWLSYETSCYKDLLLTLSDMNDSVKNIMYHKKIQMMIIFFETCGQFIMAEDISLIDIIEKNININDFKYNDFNWFKLIFNQLAFQNYIDRGLYQDSIKYISNIYNLLCFSFENKKYAIKSLNHFNKALIDDYLCFVKHFYNFVKQYLPSIYDYFNDELNKLHIFDKQFIKNELDINLSNKIYNMIGHIDTPYSTIWETKNSFRFKDLNILLKNAQK